MRNFMLAAMCAAIVTLGGCNTTGQGGFLAAAINDLNAGTVALTNFNNALITLNLTILGNIKAQAQQLAPLVCGGISLGKTLAADPAVAGNVNAYLAKHQNGQVVIAVASDLCAIGGLPTTVTAVPATASVPVAAPASGG